MFSILRSPSAETRGHTMQCVFTRTSVPTGDPEGSADRAGVTAVPAFRQPVPDAIDEQHGGVPLAGSEFPRWPSGHAR